MSGQNDNSNSLFFMFQAYSPLVGRVPGADKERRQEEGSGQYWAGALLLPRFVLGPCRLD